MMRVTQTFSILMFSLWRALGCAHPTRRSPTALFLAIAFKLREEPLEDGELVVAGGFANVR